MVNNKHLYYIAFLFLAACQSKTGPESTDVTDSSLLKVPDTSTVTVIDTSILPLDTITYDPTQLVGTWMQPVPGLEKERQGFRLNKDGSMRSINTYTLVYEKWQLAHDTLLLWNHAEGVKDTAHIIDTTIVKALTDSSLTLYPTKAAEGYLEQYVKEKEKSKKRP
ncbi:lipocalin family protein [Chitinophaga pendula]|uniref:lipocalin family protein n=1 Tax=Chitinophaga TaxID=79328 RepID=UPI000BAEFD84|nr:MULTISPECIES: lipocalin family protein [Chitinophaga]ASZ10249.1 hypothetical protein CK934_04270 [Chitinophaga sp. MD30]UCJ06791.1 lipocalin family protein [Chitinophaga pendula]